MERYVLKILKWDLRASGPISWLKRRSQADGEMKVHSMANYLLEIGLVERRLVSVVPSLLSAAALWFARLAFGREEWVRRHVHGLTP